MLAGEFERVTSDALPLASILKHFIVLHRYKMPMSENYFLVELTSGLFGIVYIYGDINRASLRFRSRDTVFFKTLKEALVEYEHIYRSHAEILSVDINIIK